MKHVRDEHVRVEAMYRKKHGKESVSALPPHMAKENYFLWLDENWEQLKDKLILEWLSVEVGKHILQALDGEEGRGTIVNSMLNHHQDVIFDDMGSGEMRQFGSKRLRAELVKLLESGRAWTADDIAAAETKLSKTEQARFAALLTKRRFTKSDFRDMEDFYNNGYERLSEYGKKKISERIWAGRRGEDISTETRDLAEDAAKKIKADFDHILAETRKQKGDDNPLEHWLTALVLDVSRCVNSEYEAAIIGWASEE